MPRCEKVNDRDFVFLPSFEMCRVTLEPCRILYNESTLFTNFLKCSESSFPCQNSINDAHQFKFNATGQCLAPLVQTESSTNFYRGKITAINKSIQIKFIEKFRSFQTSKVAVFSAKIHCIRMKSMRRYRR